MIKIFDADAPCSPFAGLLPVASLDAIMDACAIGSEGAMVDIKDGSPSALERLEAAQLTEAVSSFVGRLSPRDREIVMRIFWGGETQADVARRLGVSRMAICKAMAKITELGRRHLVAFRAVAFIN
jgi:DNA-directed RNA polymerase specialized sigma subunit